MTAQHTHMCTRCTQLQVSSFALCSRRTFSNFTRSLSSVGAFFNDCRFCLPARLACTCLPVCLPAGSPWRVWSSARPRYDNDMRYQFVVYTQEPPAAAAGTRGRQVDAVGSAPVLPPAIASQHDEYQVRRGGVVQGLLLLQQQHKVAGYWSWPPAALDVLRHDYACNAILSWALPSTLLALLSCFTHHDNLACVYAFCVCSLSSSSPSCCCCSYFCCSTSIW